MITKDARVVSWRPVRGVHFCNQVGVDQRRNANPSRVCLGRRKLDKQRDEASAVDAASRPAGGRTRGNDRREYQYEVPVRDADFGINQFSYQTDSVLKEVMHDSQLLDWSACFASLSLAEERSASARSAVCCRPLSVWLTIFLIGKRKFLSGRTRSVLPRCH